MVTKKIIRKSSRKKKTRSFYAVATEEGEFFRPVHDDIMDAPLKSTSLKEAREMRRAQRNAEDLVILKCQVIK